MSNTFVRSQPAIYDHHSNASASMSEAGNAYTAARREPLSPPAARLVPPPPAAAPVARGARPLCDPRLGDHAAANAGEPGLRLLSPLSRSLSDARGAGRGARVGGPRDLGGPRLLRPRA